MAAGDADAALPLGDPDRAPAAGTAEKGVIPALNEAVALQGEPVVYGMLLLQVPVVFLLPGAYVPREDAAVA